MENLYANEDSSRSYYVQKKSDFDRAHEIMHLMPSYAFYDKDKLDFTDVYYETNDNFLKDMGVTLRVRKFKTKQIISVKYNDALIEKQNEITRQNIYEQEMEASDSLFSQDNLLFVEDKLNVIFGGKLQMDILHKLRQLKEVYLVKTKRKSYEVVHNSGLRADVFFDEVLYTNRLKSIDYSDLILELNMTSIGTKINKQLFEEFVNKLREKLILIPMEESKYEAAILYTRFKK
ncbi:MAG: CYTH domain-containing protein [Clostridia bacterium]|nr:CYTH domain-containing protein [Clostridia bacterium]